jgi:hypothetical protein
MGWNSFDSFGCAATEEDLLTNLEVMASKFKQVGYEYFVVDNGWFAEYHIPAGSKYPLERHAEDLHIDEYGRLLPAFVNFPSGFAPLIQRTHALGLKFGIHIMRGIPRKSVELNTPILGTNWHAGDIADRESLCTWCHYNYGVDMRKPGAQEFYNSWINLLASWGVDLIKADDITEFPDEIEGIAKAIAQCGRPIILSLSPGNRSNPQYLKSYRQAQMLRVTGDIWDNRASLGRCFDAWLRWADYGAQNFWIDLDMIPFGRLQLWNPSINQRDDQGNLEIALCGEGHDRISALSPDQQRTFITMRALSASPLFIGGDLPSLDAFSFFLLTQPDMIECNQNGIVGHCVHHDTPLMVWKTPHRDDPLVGWIGIFNRSEEIFQGSLTRAELGLIQDQTLLRDIWAGTPATLLSDSLSFHLPPDGVLFFHYTRS